MKATFIILCALALCCGCKTSHGEHRTFTMAGGLYEHQNGTGNMKILWMDVNTDK